MNFLSPKHPVAACAFFFCSALVGYANSYGGFTYVEYSSYIEIIGYPKNATGEAIIPREIKGKPVTRIASHAFLSCTGLTRATIPEEVTRIGESPFYNCTSLTAITVDAYNPAYSNLDGVLFNKSQTKLIQFPGGRAGAYTIPDSVSRIDVQAFVSSSLTSITIPDGVTSIGNGAFYNCGSLTSVMIPASVSSIGERAFSTCSSLTAITVDAANSAYSSVDGVLIDNSNTMLIRCPGGKVGSVNIPDGVTSIGEFAFSECLSLTSVSIPGSVTSIGKWAFDKCSSLISVAISDGVTSIGNGAFGACTSLTNVTIPDSVTSIGNGAFTSCSSLISVMVGNGVTSIKVEAFRKCTSLVAIYFKGNAPSLENSEVFELDDNVTVYYLPWTTGWEATYSDRPTTPINVLPDPLIVGTPINGLESWFLSEWLGYYSTTVAPWLFHAQHGFVYRYPESTNGSLYFWDDAMSAWWWTNETTYPFIYRFADGVGCGTRKGRVGQGG